MDSGATGGRTRTPYGTGRLDPRVLMAVAAGGAAGAVLRWALVTAVATDAGQLPWGTLVVNLSGALVLGAALQWPRVRDDATGHAFVAVGVLGAYTTFSTVAFEVTALARDGAVGVAVAYVGLTVVGGITTSACGARGARAVLGAPR